MSQDKSMKVLVLTIGNGINILINFLTLPYLVRSLSYNDYGSYGQVLIVISLLQGLFTYNLNQVANIYFSKKEYDPKLVFSSLMRTSFLMSFIAILVMTLATPIISASFGNTILTKLLFLSVFNLLAQIPIPILLSVLIYHGKVKTSTSILIVTNILKIAIMFIAIQYFHSIFVLMAGLSLVSLIQGTILFFAIPKDLRTLKLYDKKLVKSFLGMATPLAISSIVERSVVYIDGIMISSMLNTTNFALYRAGAIEVPFVASLYGSVAAIMMPEIAKLISVDRYAEVLQLKRKVISGSVFFVYPILVFLLLFSTPIVTFYLSEKYSQSAIVFAIFNLSLFIRINDYQDIIIISGKSKFIFQLIVIMVILNIFLNYTLIRIFGIEGSAIAFILHLFIYAAVLTWKSCELLKCKFRDLFNLPLIFHVVLLSLVFSMPIWFVYHYVFKYVWFIIISAPFYLLIVYSIGLRIGLIENDLLTKVSVKIPLLSKFIHKNNVTRNSI